MLEHNVDMIFDFLRKSRSPSVKLRIEARMIMKISFKDDITGVEID
jgi:hypothetical protein